MERISPERPLLTTSRLTTESHEGGAGEEGEVINSSSSATAIVVLSTLVAVCGSYNFGAAIGYSSPAESGIVDDLGLSVAEYSVFGSVLTVGAILGSIVSGKTADLVGRRCAMGISQLFSAAGWVAIAFSQGAWLLDIGRLMIGFSVGLISIVVPVYLAEVTPRNLRGGFTTCHQLMICFGSGLTYFMGAMVSWRILALIEMVPCLVQLLGLLFIPESPRWLAKVGRDKDCEAALRRLRGKNANISLEAAEIREYTEMLRLISNGTIMDLFQNIYARSLLVGVGLMILQQIGGTNGIAFYASSIFEDAGFPSKVGPVAMAVVQLPIVIVGVLLMDKSGRKPLLMVSAAGTCFGCFLVGFSFLLEDLHTWVKVDPTLVLVGMLMYSAAFGLGLAGIPWLIMSEIFPINMKGSAGSLVAVVNWSSSWVVTYVFNFLMELSSAGTFFLFSVMSGLTILFVAKLVPETKGRTLEEIQAAMNPLSS